MSVSSRFKAIKVIGQRKTFYSKRIPEFSFVKKETVNIDTLKHGMVTGKSCNYQKEQIHLPRE